MYIYRDGKVFQKDPKGEEPVSIIVLDGTVARTLGGLGISGKDADKIIAGMSLKDKVRALNEKNFLREFVEKRELIPGERDVG